MVGNTDDLRLLVQQLAIRGDSKSLSGEADNCGSPKNCQGLDSLTHCQRQADQCDRDSHTAAVRKFPNLGDGIAGRAIDWNGPEKFGQCELARIDVNGKDLLRTKLPSQLKCGNTQTTDTENRNRLAATQSSLV